MRQTKFELIPFVNKTAPQIQITGSIVRQQNFLKVKYQLSGNLSTIIIPSPTQVPSRKYDLWEHTCCELFLRLKNTTKYWEFNLSPTGDWNVFYFADYRHSITEEMAIASLPFKVFQTSESLQIGLNIDLSKFMPAESALDVAITTVVENQARELSYWALSHPSSEADFHHQDSFTLCL